MPYEEVEIEDMEWSDELQAYTYACPCGDVFQITKVRAGGGGCLPGTRAPLLRHVHACGGYRGRTCCGWGARGGRARVWV